MPKLAFEPARNQSAGRSSFIRSPPGLWATPTGTIHAPKQRQNSPEQSRAEQTIPFRSVRDREQQQQLTGTRPNQISQSARGCATERLIMSRLHQRHASCGSDVAITRHYGRRTQRPKVQSRWFGTRLVFISFFRFRYKVALGQSPCVCVCVKEGTCYEYSLSNFPSLACVP